MVNVVVEVGHFPRRMNKRLITLLFTQCKNMVRWLMFDILKNPHLTLATIHAFKIIIKL